MGRVLGRIRLSHHTDESTSVERQREIIEKWSAEHDHEIVGWAVDVDVSRSVDPFDAPELRDWLRKKEKTDEWDFVVCWKLDRLATGSIYLNKLMAWCGEQDKAIISVTENFDLSHWVGRMIANVIAGVAEGELEAIRERTLASREKLRRSGRVGGSSPTYGMMSTPRPDGAGFGIKRDPDVFGHLRELVDRTLAKESRNSVASDFNARGILSASDHKRRRQGKPIKGTKWRANAIIAILTSPTLLGYAHHDGKVVRGEDGLPVMLCDKSEAAVSLDEWRQLQRILKEGAVPRRRSATTSLLLDVGFCNEELEGRTCGGKLHRQTMSKQTVSRGRVDYKYYRCANVVQQLTMCPGKSIPADELESVVEEALLLEIGDEEVTEKILVAGEDRSDDLEEARLAMEELVALAGAAKSQSAKALYRTQMTTLDERIAELEATPARADEWIEVGTGRTYREMWLAGDAAERRSLLIDSGIKVFATASPFTANVDIPMDIIERRFKKR